MNDEQKTASAIGLGGVIAVLIILNITPGVSLQVDADKVCVGTALQPCYGYFNISVADSMSVVSVPNGSSSYLEQPVKDSWVEQFVDGKWTRTSFDNLTFERGVKYQYRVVVLKNNPQDAVKWGILAAGRDVDPWFLGPNNGFYTPINASSQTLNSFVWFNASINSSDVLKNLTWNWDGANYTVYNSSLNLSFDFDNVTALGENITNVYDSSPSQKNGTWVGGWNYTAGAYNYSANFNGTNYISTTLQSTDINGSKGFSIAVWAKQAQSEVNYAVFGAAYNQAPAINTKASGEYDFIISGSECITDPMTLAYHRIVVTYNQSYGKIYVDGALNRTCAMNTISGTAQPFYVGWDGALSKFNGSVDALRVWNNYTLSAAEVLQDYSFNLAKVSPTNWSFTAVENLSQTSHNYQYQLWASNTTTTNTTGYQYVTTNLAVANANITIWNSTTWVPMNATNKMNFYNCTPMAWCEPLNQNASTSQPIFNVTNNGTTVESILMRTNYSIPQLNWKCGNTSAYASAFDKAIVSSFRNMSALAVNYSYVGYCWLNISGSPGYPLPPVQIEFNVTA